jgi:TRAP-type uncharacterized transport system substrate-binding protein
MSKRSVMLTCMLMLGAAGTSQAAPPDSPDIVYVDGLPCNSACQSYMAWSRATSSMSVRQAPAQPVQRSANVVARRAAEIRGERSKLEAYAHMPKQAARNSSRMPEAGTASDARTIRQQVAAAADAAAPPDNASHRFALVMARPEIKSVADLTNKSVAIDDGQSASSADIRTAIVAAGAAEVQLSNGKARAFNRLINGEVPAAVLTSAYPEAAEWSPEIAGFRIFRIPLPPHSLQAGLEPAGNAAAKSDTKSDTNPVTAPPAEAGAAANSKTRTIQKQVAAATALAEQVTAAAAPAGRPGDAENNTDHLVALLMARADIKSVSDLSGKDIAIDEGRSASNGSVRTAIAAAGAVAAQLSEGQTKAVDRLLDAEVPAAVLTLVSAEAAEWFPEIAGFKIFRVPLSPRSLQARLETSGIAAAKSDAKPATAPAKIAEPAANSNARSIQQQVAAATALAEHVTAASAVPAPQQKADNAEASVRTEAARPGGVENAAPAPADNTDSLVALLMARAEIKSVSDLSGKEVAIGEERSASSASVRIAIAAAGAPEIRLSEGHAKAIDRLIGGEVPAAVLTLVSPEAAEWFPEIAGFRIFRIPLSPRSLKARL